MDLPLGSYPEQFLLSKKPNIKIVLKPDNLWKLGKGILERSLRVKFYCQEKVEFKKSTYVSVNASIPILWPHLGSNQGLADYESATLTSWVIGPKFISGEIEVSIGFAKITFFWKNQNLFGVFTAKVGESRIWYGVMGLGRWQMWWISFAFFFRKRAKIFFYCFGWMQCI